MSIERDCISEEVSIDVPLNRIKAEKIMPKLELRPTSREFTQEEHNKYGNANSNLIAWKKDQFTSERKETLINIKKYQEGCRNEQNESKLLKEQIVEIDKELKKLKEEIAEAEKSKKESQIQNNINLLENKCFNEVLKITEKAKIFERLSNRTNIFKENTFSIVKATNPESLPLCTQVETVEEIEYEDVTSFSSLQCIKSIDITIDKTKMNSNHVLTNENSLLNINNNSVTNRAIFPQSNNSMDLESHQNQRNANPTSSLLQNMKQNPFGSQTNMTGINMSNSSFANHSINSQSSVFPFQSNSQTQMNKSLANPFQSFKNQ